MERVVRLVGASHSNVQLRVLHAMEEPQFIWKGKADTIGTWLLLMTSALSPTMTREKISRSIYMFDFKVTRKVFTGHLTSPLSRNIVRCPATVCLSIYWEEQHRTALRSLGQ